MEDIENVAKIAERALSCLIYRLLEKVIDQEVELGQLDFSLPRPILSELKAMKEHLKECERVEEGTDFEKWIHHKIIIAADQQLEYMLKTHHLTFYQMTTELDLTDEFSFAYDTFVRICKELMSNEVTWYRIIALLCFGAEVAVFVIKKGGPGVQGFIDKIVHYVVEFIVKEEIAEWISLHGGWISMIDAFDSHDCTARAQHIATIMSISEVTSAELQWLQRIALAALISAIGYSIFKIFARKS